MYPNVTVTRETVRPKSLGLRRLGHFGFVRKQSGEHFWRRIAEWLVPSQSA